MIRVCRPSTCLRYDISQRMGRVMTTHRFPASSSKGRRWISVDAAARNLLGLPDHRVDLKMLRQAYFVAAKKCHPDAASHHQASSYDNMKKHDNNPEAFLELTTAYELLLGQLSRNSPIEERAEISLDEDQAFRKACKETLGIDADTVEECKRTPAFRRWLSGRTDAAEYWRNFLMTHGGLAPKLKVISGILPAGKDTVMPLSRRKRRR